MSMIAKFLTLPTLVCSQYEVYGGSHALGIADAQSDKDIFGFYIAEPGQLLEIQERLYRGDDRYDFWLFDISNFFEVIARSELIQTLFVDDESVLHTTEVARLVRRHRDIFISKATVAGMLQTVEAIGIMDGRMGIALWNHHDTWQNATRRFLKEAGRTMHLLDLCEQMLVDGTLDLRRHHDVLLEIRANKWTREQIMVRAQEKHKQVMNLFERSRLPDRTDTNTAGQLIEQCLQLHRTTAA